MVTTHSANPDEYDEQEKKMNALKLEDAKKLKLKIVYGNTYRVIKNARP